MLKDVVVQHCSVWAQEVEMGWRILKYTSAVKFDTYCIILQYIKIAIVLLITLWWWRHTWTFSVLCVLKCWYWIKVSKRKHFFHKEIHVMQMTICDYLAHHTSLQCIFWYRHSRVGCLVLLNVPISYLPNMYIYSLQTHVFVQVYNLCTYPHNE